MTEALSTPTSVCGFTSSTINFSSITINPERYPTSRAKLLLLYKWSYIPLTHFLLRGYVFHFLAPITYSLLPILTVSSCSRPPHPIGPLLCLSGANRLQRIPSLPRRCGSRSPLGGVPRFCVPALRSVPASTSILTRTELPVSAGRRFVSSMKYRPHLALAPRRRACCILTFETPGFLVTC